MEKLEEGFSTGLSLAEENLKCVSFKGQGLKLNSGEDAKPIVDALNECQHMTTLTLEGNTVAPDAAKAIGEALGEHPEFERAKWSDMFTGRLKSEIPPALKSLSDGVMKAGAKLKELDLSDNAFGALGVEGITALLRSPSCYSLEELRLNNNGLGITGGQLLAKTLLECHEAGSKVGMPLKLRVFVSGRNRLENEGATALAEAFKTLGSLEYVSMPQNGIHYPGINALATAFKSNKNLQTINLCDNTFTHRGAQAFAEALPGMNKLESINFESCLIKSSGAGLLANAIREGVPALRELNLQFNEINCQGGVTVCGCLSSKQSLSNVLLGGNQFGESGKTAVLDAVKAAGKQDCFGSLSEDEGSEDEDDEEEDGDGDEDNESEDETETHSQQVDPQEFFKQPSSQLLLGLQLDSLRSFLRTPTPPSCDNEHERIHTLMTYFMKVASVISKSSSSNQLSRAFEVSDCVFECMTCDQDNYFVLANCVLVHFGLIKSEDKKFKPVTTDLYGPLVLLNHAMEKRRFSKESTKMLNYFFAQKNERLDSNFEKKGILLKTMYRL